MSQSEIASAQSLNELIQILTEKAGPENPLNAIHEDLIAVDSYYRTFRKKIKDLSFWWYTMPGNLLLKKGALTCAKNKIIRSINDYDSGANPNNSFVLIKSPEIKEKFIRLLKKFVVDALDHIH